MTADTKAILITGTSTGIGAACAFHFDRLGYAVYAGVRRAEDGAALTRQASSRLQTLILDVTDPTAIAEAERRLSAELGENGLFGLVNNAGIAVAGPLEIIPLEELRMQFEVNVIGQVAITQSALPLLRRRRGRIVNIGSIAGLTATPVLGPYCASKFALEALTDALRLEVQPWGIDVAIVEPGSVATPIWQKSIDRTEAHTAGIPAETLNLYGTLIDSIKAQAQKSGARAISADAVVAAVEHALTAPNPKTRYLVGTDAKMRAWASWLLPDRWMDRLLTRVIPLPGRG